LSADVLYFGHQRRRSLARRFTFAPLVDLVEVYIVRNAMDGEIRVHLALVPAFRLLFRYFFRIFGSFLLTG